MADDDQDFEKQLYFEAQEKALTSRDPSTIDPYTYTDPNDGTQYEWDGAKQAWFPKVTDDFLAAYQANYGNYVEQKKEGDTSEVGVEKKEQAKAGEKRKAPEPSWFEVDDAHNTNVYVSGLPLSTTEKELAEIMGKCGLIMKDPLTNQLKLKMYRNRDDQFKGDALCCYIKVESVELALNILDGSRLDDKHTLKVERAQFKLKGAYDPTKKPKRKTKGAKDKEKMKKRIEKLFDWRPDRLRGERAKWEKTVILKNMFDIEEFESDATLILEYQRDVRDECLKCGEVKKVVVYDRNKEGVVSVTFKEAEEADECIRVMNGRWFASRQLVAATWDGKERFKIEESEAELEKRLKKWDDFLEADDKQREDGATSATITPCSLRIGKQPNEKQEEPNNKKVEPGGLGDEPKGAELTDEEKHSGEDSDEEKPNWP